MVVMSEGQALLFPSTPVGFILLVQPFSRKPVSLTSRLQLSQFNEIPPKKYINSLCPRTLQVQVFGSCGRLRRDLGINLDGVEVVGVPGDYDVVPVVVVQGLV